MLDLNNFEQISLTRLQTLWQEMVSTEEQFGLLNQPILNIVLLMSSGPEFESRIRQNEINNPKFNFLNNGDPYNAYFQHKVKEFKESIGKGKV